MDLHGAAKKEDTPLLTYKRRNRSRNDAAVIRKTCDAVEVVEKEDPSSEAGSPSTSEPTPEKLSAVAALFKRAALSPPRCVKRVPDSKRTVAPPAAPLKRGGGQYFLDLGQADFSHTTCPACGLVYARGLDGDEKLHASFHRSQFKGIHFKGGWGHERVALRVSGKGDRVIYVVPGDPPGHVGKVREVVRVMEQEMGLSPGWLWQRHCKAYLFISAAKKIVGCIVAEPIAHAYPIVPPPTPGADPWRPPAPETPSRGARPDAEGVPACERFYRMSIGSRATEASGNPEQPAHVVPQSGGGSDLDSKDLGAVSADPPLPPAEGRGAAPVHGDGSVCGGAKRDRPTRPLARLDFGNWRFTREVVTRKRRRAEERDLGQAVLCSKSGVPAVCGVRGMWVSRAERRKGVATHLLDAMRKTFCLGLTLPPSQCAFSQPTPDGHAFAARYCGTAAFLVYQSLRSSS